jgi:ABC-2 type transport system permease protein
MNKIWAFYKRDLQLAMTYRFGFLIDVGQIFIQLISFFFIAKLFNGGKSGALLDSYGGDYFSFVLIGIAFSGFMSTALGVFPATISFEQGSGTLEAILMTPTPIGILAGGKALSELTLVTIKAAICLVFGILFFHADFSKAHWGPALVSVVLTVFIFLSVGMMSAAFILAWRESGPIEFIVAGASRFLAGVYFPIAVFPGWLRTVAKWVPLTYTLEVVRKSLMVGSSFSVLSRDLFILGLFALFLLPLGLFLFQWGFREARKQGNLGLS